MKDKILVICNKAEECEVKCWHGFIHEYKKNYLDDCINGHVQCQFFYDVYCIEVKNGKN